MSIQGSRRRAAAWVVAGLICVCLSLPALGAYEPDPSAPRSDIPENARWNSDHIFPDRAAWEAELQAIQVDMP
jgi:hypothetical protein